jgi:hypothetical protein
MVCVQTKNPIWVNFGGSCNGRFGMSNLWPLEIHILWRFVYFVVIWYIFPRFGILEQEKSGKPASL